MSFIDDCFTEAGNSKKLLMSNFNNMYEDSKVEKLSNLKITRYRVWSVIKMLILGKNNSDKFPIFDHLHKKKLESNKFVCQNRKPTGLKEVTVRLQKIFLQKIMARHLHKFEKNFVQYENAFEEWKEKEDNRFDEIDQHISDHSESLDVSQVDRIMEISNFIEGIAEDLAPKFRQIVEHLEELSRQLSDYEFAVAHRYECIAVRVEHSFGGQIEEFLDFSDYYRGMAISYNPNSKLSIVFDDVDSLIEHINAN